MCLVQLDNITYEAKKVFIVNPYHIAAYGDINRNIRSCFEEIGINPNKPIREQKPNPLPNRKALDDIVFDILGLTQAERD